MSIRRVRYEAVVRLLRIKGVEWNQCSSCWSDAEYGYDLCHVELGKGRFIETDCGMMNALDEITKEAP